MKLSNVFKFADKQLRVAGTSNEPWFNGKDVSDILGYVNSRQTLSDHIRDKHKASLSIIIDKSGSHETIQLNKNNLKAIYINEAGLYCLIMKSKMKEAERFQDYVFEEVLPSIRKNGYFVSSNISPEKVTQLENELAIANKTIEKNSRKIIKLNELTMSSRELKKNEVFYIATSPTYAKNNRLKFGGVSAMKDIASRLSSYNTGRAEGDLFYYAKIVKCHKYRQLESNLSTLASGFKDKSGGQKEMICMRYNCLNKLVDFIDENIGKGIDFMNEHCAQFINEIVEFEPIEPVALELKDYIVIRQRKKGKITEVDVSEWTEEQINSLLKKMINEYAESKTGEPYDFDTDKNSKKLQIEWKDFYSKLDSFSGKGKLGWRENIKKLLTCSHGATFRLK